MCGTLAILFCSVPILDFRPSALGRHAVGFIDRNGESDLHYLFDSLFLDVPPAAAIWAKLVDARGQGRWIYGNSVKERRGGTLS